MIITVTTNPAIDFSIITNQVALGQVQVIDEAIETVGGKGINVSKVLNLFRVSNSATGFLGKENAHVFFDFFDSNGMIHDFVLVEGKTRTNIKVNETAAGRTTDLNAKGFLVTKPCQEALLNKIVLIAKKSNYVVLSGSLPQGCGDDFYAKIVSMIMHDTMVVVDADKQKLRLAVEAGAHIIKPNKREIEQAFNKTFSSDQDCVAFCIGLIKEYSLEKVLLTLGENGAVMITEKAIVYSKPIAVEVMGTVGAGDSFLGGCLAGFDQGFSDVDAFKMGVACGTCAVLQKGTDIFSLDAFQKIFKRMRVVQ